MNPDRWSYEPIMTVAKQSAMNGIGDGKFGPTEKVNIAQVWQMLVNCGFSDEAIVKSMNTVFKLGIGETPNSSTFTEPTTLTNVAIASGRPYVRTERTKGFVPKMAWNYNLPADGKEKEIWINNGEVIGYNILYLPPNAKFTFIGVEGAPTDGFSVIKVKADNQFCVYMELIARDFDGKEYRLPSRIYFIKDDKLPSIEGLGERIKAGGTSTQLHCYFSSPIEWISSNPKVAEVSEDGIVTAINLGTAYITAVFSKQNSDTYEIIVTE